MMNSQPATGRLRRYGFGVVVAGFLPVLVSAADWTQYRGPTYDGVSTEIIRTNWTEAPPRLVWKIPMEPAWSSLTIRGRRVFTQANRPLNGEPTEFCVALDADTGEELWATPVGRARYPEAGAGPDDGPRSTPSVDGDRVYVFNSYLALYCLEAATGVEVWRKDFVAEWGATVIAWQSAASPMIMGDLIFLNSNAGTNRLCALNKHDGSVVWRAHNVAMTHSTPIYTVLDHVPQVVFLTQAGLVSVAPDTGELRWRLPFPYATSSAASPVTGSNIVFCSAAYGAGSAGVYFSQRLTNLLWQRRGANMNHWATPVHYEGFLYGNFGQSDISFRCVDLTTGQEKWRHAPADIGRFGSGGVLRVRDLLLALTEYGFIVLVQPDATAYREIGRFRALERTFGSSPTPKCWNVPALSNGRIYARSTSEVACYDVAPPPSSRPRLIADRGADGLGFHLVIVNDDGSPVDEGQAARLEVLAANDPTVPPSQWFPAGGTLIRVQGRLRVIDMWAPDDTQGFYRLQQRQ